MKEALTFWCGDSALPAIDNHVAFRGEWQMVEEAEVTVRILGASWFVVWMDGKRLADGPARFARTHPEYQDHKLQLSAGRHVLAIHVNGCGYETRLLQDIEPFLHARVLSGERELPVAWKCAVLTAFWANMRRINPPLGSIEWCDTRLLPEWQLPAFDDKEWS